MILSRYSTFHTKEATVMKRIVALALTLCMLLSCSSALAGITTTLTMRLATRTGPGTEYTEPGSFFSKGHQVIVHSKVWDDANDIWWVQVEFTYQGSKYRAYTGAKRISANISRIPVEQPLGSCTLIFDADAFAGPGWEYQMWQETICRGTQATLIEVEGSYGHIECWSQYEQMLWRVWVDLDCLDCGYLYGGGSYHDSEEYEDAYNYYYGN